MPPDGGDLGQLGFGDDRLTATLATFVGVGSDADLPADVRFLVNVARVIRTRLRRAANPETVLSIFCFLPSGAPEGAAALPAVPMLDDGTTTLGGRVWCVGPMAARGVPLDISDQTDGECFRNTIASGAGDVPAVVFKPQASTGVVRVYPEGLKSADQYREVPLGGTPIPIDRILDAVDQIYRTSLITPDAQADRQPTWKLPGSHFPIEEAEKVVQGYLQIGLRARFPAFRITTEQAGVAGRTDLEIDEIDPGTTGITFRHAVLELKVLRDFYSSGRSIGGRVNAKSVHDGVGQAAIYRDEKKMRDCALCCFDMRAAYSGDACFNQLQRARARRAKVTLRCWHLFSTAAQLRDHLMAANEVSSP